MNAARVTLSRESICATCLSQDRKLFPVNDSKPHAIFLNVSEEDMLCWECNFFMLKAAAFRSRAARAQALLGTLNSFTNVIQISSLSNLTITPVYQDISVQISDPLEVDIKSETIKEETENIFDELPYEGTWNNDNVSCDESREAMGDDTLLPALSKQREGTGDELICGEARSVDIASLKSFLSRNSSNNQRKAKGDERSCGKAMGDDIANASLKTLLSSKSSNNQRRSKRDERSCGKAMGDDIANASLKTLLSSKSSNNQREAKSDERSCGEAIGDSIANASLKTLLSRKSTLINIRPLAKKYKKDDTKASEIEEVEEASQEKVVAEVESVKQTPPSHPDPAYTEITLTEEELLQWRERKKNAPLYAIKTAALRCDKCIEPFKNMIVYLAHARRHEENYGSFACHVCGLRSLCESSLRAHTTKHYRLLKCNVCGHEWDSPNAMRQHCSVAHGIPITIWDCDHCERTFPSSLHLARHTVIHREVLCRVCGERIPQKMITHHMRVHKGIPVHVCAVCGRQCKGDDRLASHMKTHETKVDEAAYCADCNIQFRTMQRYRHHRLYTLKHARSEDMPYKCDECSKQFLHRSGLISHLECSHNKELKYACRICNQKFKSRHARNHHARKVHAGVGSQKNLICDYCGKAFKAKITLLCHINTHTGARPFACTLCGATFGHKSALYLHGRLKHKIKKKSEAKKVEGSALEKGA